MYEVWNHPIFLTLEEYNEVCDLPNTYSLYTPDELELGDDFYFVNDVISFLSNPNNDIPTSFTTGYMHQIFG